MVSIDIEISDIINQLNERGYKTYASCVGGGGDRHDGDGQHYVEPNIGFYDLPKSILDEITKEGLQWRNVGDDIEKHDGRPTHKDLYRQFFVYHEYDSAKFFRVIKKIFLKRINNTDHLVFLIGEKDTGSIEANREECPQLDSRAAHSDLACLHCGGYFPMSRLLPLDVDMVGAISKAFRRNHRSCTKNSINKSNGLYTML